MINIISLENLDKIKYSNCINTSEQYVFYAELEFLESCNCHLEFLILNDYQAVMPITIIYKYFYKLVINPKLCQQLGVFSKKDNPEINKLFYQFLIKNYRVWYYAFNQNNSLKGIEHKLIKRNNYLLYTGVYIDIFNNYSPKRKRKLRLNPEFIGKTEIKLFNKKDVLNNFIIKHQKGYSKSYDKQSLFEFLWKQYNNNKLDFISYFYNNQLISVLCLYKSEKSVALFGIFNDSKFFKLNASSQLLDFAIKSHIESKNFDFEGSNISEIEAFFSGFRPKLHHYFAIRNSKFKIILPKLSF